MGHYEALVCGNAESTMQAEDAIFLAGLCSRIRQWLASVGLASVLPYSSVSRSLLVVLCPGRTASVELEAGPPRFFFF